MRNRGRVLLWMWAGALVLLLSCSSSTRPAFFVAASLGDLVDAALAQSGVEADVHLAGSGTLRVQILQGAGADLLVAADLASAEGLGDRPVALWRNELVLVASSGPWKVESLPDLPGLPCVAMADPDLAPAGRYAREALQVRGLWRDVSRVATGAPNVRAALSQVASGACPAGVVYATDARTTRKVRVVETIPLPVPVTYYAVVPSAADHPGTGEDFLAFLQGPQGAALARDYGLVALGVGQ